MDLDTLSHDEVLRLVRLQADIFNAPDSAEAQVVHDQAAKIGWSEALAAAAAGSLEAKSVAQATYDELENLVANEMQKVVEREEAIQLILDSMEEGLVGVDVDGYMTEVRSSVIEKWFGPVSPGAPVSAYLFPDDDDGRASFELAFEQAMEDVLPFEVAAEVFPREIVHQGHPYRLKVRAVREAETVTGIVINVRDAQAELRAEQAEAEARELASTVRRAVENRSAFRLFLAEMDHLLGSLNGSSEAVDVPRVLHTLKGNAALAGFDRFSKACHEEEDRLMNTPWTRDAAVALTERWREASSSARAIVEHGHQGVSISDEELTTFVGMLEAAEVPAHVMQTVVQWQLPRVADFLENACAQAQRLAQRLGRRVEVELVGGEHRIPRGETERFFSSLVHLLRNAVDHGIESPDERQAVGKPAIGRLRVQVTTSATALCIAVEDDGRGIVWDRVADKARGAGLPADTHDDLVAALFSDGVSTATAITEISGRGVGLPAVRAAAEAAGGSVGIASSPSRGTCFSFTFPNHG